MAMGAENGTMGSLRRKRKAPSSDGGAKIITVLLAMGGAFFLLAVMSTLSRLNSSKAESFYEDPPHLFAEGDRVDLKVNKMTSTQTLLPLDYYHLPFCRPEGNEVELDDQNLGQILSGDRIQSSPYRLRMKEDMFCEQLCRVDIDREEKEGLGPNRMVRAIRNNYHHNFLVDSLPSASKVEDDYTVTTRYWGGFPIGFVAIDTGEAYIHNHVNIEIQYNNDNRGRARIVRFIVEPFSIKHYFDDTGEIQHPIHSCNPEFRGQEHTRYEMVYARGREPQPASGTVLFTYDVIWIENKDLHWPSRWHVYLTMDDAIPDKVHWFSIANSLALLFVTSAMIATILARSLCRDSKYYKRLATDEEKADIIIEFGWKLVHADVFRLPCFSPLLLAACCGTGATLLCTAFGAILLAALGFIKSTKRGLLLMALLALYVPTSFVGGYITARFYKTFKGERRQKAAACTAFGFPGVTFGLCCIVDAVALSVGSTYAVPLRSIVLPIFLWFVCSTSLVFYGAHLGYKQSPIDIPVSRRSAPRKIPAQPWSRRLPMALAASSLVNIGVIYVELYFILGAMWMGYSYHHWGFLLLVLAILIITCAQISVLLNFIQISGENYLWWWRSFSTGGSAGLGIFIYSFVYLFDTLGKNEKLTLPASVVYFGCSVLLALGLFLMTGFVGTSACIWFNKTMFSSIVGKDCPDDEASQDSSPQASLTPTPDLQSRKIQNECSKIAKTLLAMFVFVAFFLPMLFYPSHSDGANNYRYLWDQAQSNVGGLEPGDAQHGVSVAQSSNTIIGERDIRVQKEEMTHSPYHYGLNFNPSYDAEGMSAIAIAASLWAAIISLTIAVKRRSAGPGGRLYLYNQRKIREILYERKRRLRDILSDPVLKEDTKRMFGDNLTSLLDVVAEWQLHGFHDVREKNECVCVCGLDIGSKGFKIGRKVIVPWIRSMNVFLAFLASVTIYCAFDNFLSIMILSLVFVHILDNLVLYRAAASKGAPWIAKREGIFAAVGIPVIEVV